MNHLAEGASTANPKIHRAARRGARIEAGWVSVTPWCRLRSARGRKERIDRPLYVLHYLGMSPFGARRWFVDVEIGQDRFEVGPFRTRWNARRRVKTILNLGTFGGKGPDDVERLVERFDLRRVRAPQADAG